MDNLEPKKTKNKQLILTGIIFIVVLLSIAGISFLVRKQIVPPVTVTPTPTPEQETPTMMLSFTPNIVKVAPNGNIKSDIEFNTLGNPSKKVSVVVSYDPKQVTNTSLTPVKDPTSALSYSFNLIAGTRDTDPKNGILSQTFIIPQSIPAAKGHGIIARFTGTLQPGVTTTVIKITNTSSATSPTISRVVLGKVNLEVNPAQ